MAEKVFKIGEEIEIVYQAPNKETGLTGPTAVEAKIYLPNDVEDSDFPLQDLVEIGSSGIYKGVFTPDEQGEWKVIIYKSADGDGQVVKRYSVGAHNVHSVGEGVGAVDTAVADLDADIVDLDSDVAAVDGKVDTVDGKVDGVQGTADSIETKVDSITSSVASLDTPPMVS